jgi:hypothetical protein
MVQHGDYSMVYADKYPEGGTMLFPPSAHDGEIEAQRTRIEKNPKVMNDLSAQLYPEEKKKAARAKFEYKGASVNNERGELVLWYMGPIRMPIIKAGYRAQWVYDLKKDYLSKLYLSIVPLE